MRKYQEAIAGDIVLWDGEKKVVVPQDDYTVKSFPEDKFTPIGVVVIPASHMCDGKARMMSTRWMSCDDPENGKITISGTVWGTAADLSGLPKFTEVPVISRYDAEYYGEKVPLTVPQIIYTTSSYGFLPSDFADEKRWSGETNPEDDGTRWHESDFFQTGTGFTVTEGLGNFYAPSPYASDGTPNPLYRATEYNGGSINNALSYFDGRYQTDVILKVRGEKDYGTWKPEWDDTTSFLPATVCDMYHTVGTKQGDWYLPSIAELGYIVARLQHVNNALNKTGGIQSLPSSLVWSSTMYDESSAWSIYFGNGGFNSWFIDRRGCETVIAFATV